MRKSTLVLKPALGNRLPDLPRLHPLARLAVIMTHIHIPSSILFRVVIRTGRRYTGLQGTLLRLESGRVEVHLFRCVEEALQGLVELVGLRSGLEWGFALAEDWSAP